MENSKFFFSKDYFEKKKKFEEDMKEFKRQEYISNCKHQICVMMDEISYLQKMIRDLENGGELSDSNSED